MFSPNPYEVDSYGTTECFDNHCDTRKARNSSSKSLNALGSSTKGLTVPVKKLPGHQLNRSTPKSKQVKVTASRRSEAAKQLSRAYAQAQKLNPVVVIKLVTPAVASSAVSAVRTTAPTTMTSSKSLDTRKWPIRPPCGETDFDNTSTSLATLSRGASGPFGPTAQSTDFVPSPARIPRTISRSSMLQANRKNAQQVSSKSKPKLTSTPTATASVPLKNFSKSVLLRNCSCSLRAMLVCRSCGAFCHHDCISTAQLCSACVN